MNYFEHHLGDYDGATAHLSWLEDCAYRRLICLYYRNESPIPADLKQACRLVRAATKPERDAVEQVLREFFELRDDGWHQERCDQEIARYQERSQKARNSVSKRWANRDANAVRTQYEGDTNVLPTNNEGNTTRARPHLPSTNHQTPERESPRVARATRLSADWEPTEDMVAWCKETRPDLNPQTVAERFRDHWIAKAGKDGAKLDWTATWRNWVRGERAQFNAQPAEPRAWHETRQGVERKAKALGIGPWVEAEEQYPTYRQRVMAAAREKQPSSGFDINQLAAMAEARKVAA